MADERKEEQLEINFPQRYDYWERFQEFVDSLAEPSPEERLERLVKKAFIDLLVESVAEADQPFFDAMLAMYQNDDSAAMGDLLYSNLRSYIAAVAKARGLSDE